MLPSPDGASGSAQDVVSLSWTSPTMLVTASAMASCVRYVELMMKRLPLHLTQTCGRDMGKIAMQPIP